MAELRQPVCAALLELYEDGHVRVACPVCKGGSSKEKCMSLWPSEDGSMMATCHRANCGVGTIMISNTKPAQRAQAPRKSRVPKLWYSQPNEQMREWLKDNYEYPFARDVIDNTMRGTKVAAVFPMFGPDFEQHGVIVKPFNPGTGPKSLTYKDEDDYNGMSWYANNYSDASHRLFVVEDPLSAIALHQHTSCATVSLNGTLLNDRRMGELLEYKWQIVLMLDADATRKAIKYAQRYGPDVIRVVRLEKDIKNMTAEEVTDLLAREEL